MNVEAPKEDDVHVYIKQVGHIYYLVVEDGEYMARERIPSHVMKMEEKARHWFMKEFITRVKRKMYKIKGKGQLVAFVRKKDDGPKGS